MSLPSHYGSFPLFFSPSSCSLLILLPVWQCIAKMVSIPFFWLLKIILRKRFDQFLAWPCSSSQYVYRLSSSSRRSSLVSNKLLSQLLGIALVMFFRTLPGIENRCTFYVATDVPDTKLFLPFIVPAWPAMFAYESLHHTQPQCIRATATSFRIDPDASHLREAWEELTRSHDWLQKVFFLFFNNRLFRFKWVLLNMFSTVHLKRKLCLHLVFNQTFGSTAWRISINWTVQI